jgi:hypothetical protein
MCHALSAHTWVVCTELARNKADQLFQAIKGVTPAGEANSAND